MDDEPVLHPVVEETASDIAAMEIRGAAAIADAAAEALAIAATESEASGAALRAELRASARRLHDTRPTAISLANGIREVLGDLLDPPDADSAGVADAPGSADAGRADGGPTTGDAGPTTGEGAPTTGDAGRPTGDGSSAAGDGATNGAGSPVASGGDQVADPEDLASCVAERAAAFRADLADAQAAVGRVGGNRLSDGDVICTHCHSTAAMACVEHAVERGCDISAYVKETRPRLQGHETARHLRELGVDVTLVVDGAAYGILEDVDRVLVGADSVAADGTLVNKVGTASLAASAAARDVPVLVAASTVKLNPETLSGAAVPIEERSPDEVVDPERRREIGDPAVANPAFDRTPARFLDAIATEAGLIAPGSVGALLRERYGADPPRPWLEPGEAV